MKHTRLKAACYTTNITMAVVGNLPPLLFMPFREIYGVSYTLLGLLVLINFTTQLTVDLLFSFFSKKVNIPFIVKFTPILSLTGLAVFGLSPVIFSGNVYAGLVLGSVIFAASSGLAEVLISPIIAALPSEHPDRDMSLLHSIYAWGVVGVVILSAVFLKIFDIYRWQILVAIFCLIPLAAFVLFSRCTIPNVISSDESGERLGALVKRGVLLFVASIFAGGFSECVMAQWSSGYLERALGIKKFYGDVFGVAAFALFLGLGRTLYSKIGKNIERTLILGFSGAALCYLTAALTKSSVLGLIACGLTGFCTSMLWPGSLILVSDKLVNCGVTVYALMAAGGDLGAAIGPQMVGAVTDIVIASEKCTGIAETLGMSKETLGMKLGFLVSALFALCGIIIVFIIMKRFKKQEKEIKNP